MLHFDIVKSQHFYRMAKKTYMEPMLTQNLRRKYAALSIMNSQIAVKQTGSEPRKLELYFLIQQNDRNQRL